MLYLAEVQKKGGGLLGGGKAELKLLACQRAEQSWSAVPGDESIVSDEASSYNAGALVLVELTANKQVQRVQEAGRQLVSILQNFSRLQEKSKTKEEEIDQWKQSLTYQSQELNRREMEMESRREQLQQMEEDFEQLEQQRQEFDATRDEVMRQRDELERTRHELEGAWEHLRGETRRLEERQGELQQSTVLDDDKASTLHELLDRLASAAPPTETLQEQIAQSLTGFQQQQSLLAHHWQSLEQQRNTTQQSQTDLDRQAQDLQNRWQEWQKSQDSLEQARAELKVQQNALNQKQEYSRMLGMQLQNQEDLYQQTYRLSEVSDKVTIGQPIDTEALSKMSVDEVQRVAQDLERDLEKLSRFVESQEEELALKQQEINTLQSQSQSASPTERRNLESELADEQDGYQMLNETLVGQRRSLKEREGVLRQHQAFLRRRQGHSDGEPQSGSEIDLGPILNQIESQRQQQADELRKLESQVEQMRSAIQQAEGMISSQTAEQENKRSDLKQQEQALQGQRSAVAESWGRVNLYQEMLQPIQDVLDAIKQPLEDASGTIALSQDSGIQQQQAIAEMRRILLSLTNLPELAVS